MHGRPIALSLLFVPLLLADTSGIASAATVAYTIDPDHTYPSFEADHLGGLSTWRGKFDRTSGTVSLDKAADTGRVYLRVDLASVDFGHAKLNEYAKGDQLFDVVNYPDATYTGKLEGFVNGVPSRVVGDLNLHGVTRPVVLRIDAFKCMPHPMLKREVCGADALATFKRDDFGLGAGKDYGFSMDVTLRIQVEAIADKPTTQDAPAKKR